MANISKAEREARELVKVQDNSTLVDLSVLEKEERQELKEELLFRDAGEIKETLHRIDSKPTRRMGTVIIKPSRVYDRKVGTVNNVSILPGAKHTLAPIDIGYGAVETGISEEEFKELKLSRKIDYHSFFAGFKVSLTDSAKVLDLSNEYMYLEYMFLKSRPEVASTPEAKNAQTVFVMYDEEAEAKNISTKVDKKMESFNILHSMSFEEQLDFLKLFGIKVKGISPDVAKSKLALIIEDKPDIFITRFKDKNKIERILLESLVQSEVCSVRGGAYYYNEEIIGATEDLAVQFLNSPRNQELKINLMTVLKAKQRIG